MDPVLRLVRICEEVIEAGTMVPGHWASSQRRLVNSCRETLNELGDEQVQPRERLPVEPCLPAEEDAG